MDSTVGGLGREFDLLAGITVYGAQHLSLFVPDAGGVLYGGIDADHTGGFLASVCRGCDSIGHAFCLAGDGTILHFGIFLVENAPDHAHSEGFGQDGGGDGGAFSDVEVNFVLAQHDAGND